MRIDGDTVTFDCTGRKEYAHGGVIGLGPNGEATEGWDGGFPSEPLGDQPLTRAERSELALYMVERWWAFAEGK